jgi:ribonuclease-3
MSGRGKGKSQAAAQQPTAVEVLREASAPSVASDGPKDARRRRRRGDGSLEERIGYRFKDIAMLDSALSHISALKGARNRASSYQRLEFLGDHVLGLVISDMLFRAFPKADEGELSRRLRRRDPARLIGS